MSPTAQNELLAKLPVAELEAESEKFVEPVTKRLPEKRLKTVVRLAVRGISGAYAAGDHADSALSGAHAAGCVGGEQTLLRALRH